MLSRTPARRSIMLASVATSWLLAPGTATAQSTQATVPAPDEETGVVGDEIVITARKRAERLVDVPIAVTSLSSEDVARLQANDLSGIQGAAPNVNLVQGRGSTSSANIFIRGVGQPDALQTFDPAVGVYVDGVYISRIQGALFNLFDVDRVEVLRGPQGTLYGKNTIAGAINIVSKKPDLTETRGAGSFTYGSYDQLLGNAYVSVPLVADKVALSVAGVYDKRDGLVTDPLTGRRYNDRDNQTVRAILRARPTDSLELLLSGDYSRQRTSATLGYPTAPLIQTSLFPAGTRIIVPAFPYGPYNYRASTSLQPGQGQKQDQYGVSLTANYELSNLFSVTSITAYRHLKPELWVDIDATERSIADIFLGFTDKQFSQELQLKLDGNRLKGVAGLYYLSESIRSDQIANDNDLFTLLAAPVTFSRFINDNQLTHSYAAFGQLTYDLTDKLSLTGGLRYTYETKRYNRFTTTASSLAALNGLAYTFPDSLPAPFNTMNKVDFDAFTPSATLSYKPSRDTLLYVSAANGFKSGGFNGRVNSTADVTQIIGGVPTIVPFFKPETVWSYEVGAKADFLDGRVRLSGDAFYSDYRDFQARVGGGTTAAGLSGSFPVLNAGKLRIWGIEADLVARPTDAWTVRSTLGYLNAKYLEFNDGRRTPPFGRDSFSCNPSGMQVTCQPAFAPPISFSLASDYVVDFGGSGSLTVGGDLRFIDKQFLSVDNRPNLTEDGYALVNAFVQYDDPSQRWYVRGGVKNLTKTLYLTDGQEFSSVGNIQTAYYGDPRTFSGTIGFRF